MTKRSMLLSLASGKLGDMVFYRAGGEQRTRTRVVPKNPKSIAQMNQRLRMLNPSSIYRSLHSILGASFTERKSNQSSANKFMSEAISTLPYYITKQMKEELLCVPFGAKLSSGSLGLRVEAVTKNVDPQQSDKPLQAQVYDCLFDTWQGAGGGFMPYPSPIAGFGGVLHDEEGTAAFLRASLIPSVPEKFTISVIAGAPVLIDEDKEIYAWKLGVRTYAVDGDEIEITYRGCPEADDFAHLHAVHSLRAGTKMSICAGMASEDGVEVAKHPTAIILSYEQDGKLVVTNSFVSSSGATGTTPKKRFDRYFKDGGMIYVQTMSEYGFSQGSALNGQVLNTRQEAESDSEEEEGGEDLTS